MKLNIDTSQLFPAVGRALMGHGAFQGTGSHGNLSFLGSLLEITRPFLVIMGIPTAGMGAFLAAGVMPSPPVLLLGAVAAVLAASAIHAFNDWVDRKRDRAVWPNRPIPAGRLSPSSALLFAALLAAGSLTIIAVAFGMPAFLFLLAGLVLSILYCVFMRDALGRLSLPAVIAIFPVGGWAAISPETLFASPMPWLLAAVVATWQTAHTTVKMPARPVKEIDGKKLCIDKALLFYPSPATAAAIGFAFCAALLIEVVVLGFLAFLGPIYWVLAVPITVITFLTSLRLLASSSDKRRSILAFNTASMALTFISGGICLDMLVRVHLGTFVSWTVQAGRDVSAWLESRTGSIGSFAYWAVLIIAALVTLASVGKILKELMRKEPGTAT